MIRWGLVGLGRAGMARRRALEAHIRCQLVCESSRRDANTNSFSALLKRDVDAVALCRESATHAADALAALRAGKHVLLEYPLALTRREAESVLLASRRSGRLIHVGHLAMLSPFHAQVCSALEDTQLTAFSYRFQAGYGRAVRPLSEAGQWGQNANSRLQALWSWFGPLELQSARVHVQAAGYTLNVELRNLEGIKVTLIESRLEGQKRTRYLSGMTYEGTQAELPQWVPWRGGFAADTAHFVERLTGDDVQSYVPVESMVDVVALSEQISDRAKVLTAQS